MSAGFCGEDGGSLQPAWSSLLEDFTPCFEALVVTALPFYLLLVVGLPMAIYYTLRRPWRAHGSSAFPGHWIHVAQLASGLAVSLMAFSRLLMLVVGQEAPAVAPYQLYGALTVLLAWLLGTALWLYAGLRGVYYDPVAVLFCVLQFCVYLLALRTRILAVTTFHQEVSPEFVAFCIEFAVMLVYISLCVFFAQPPAAYWEQRSAEEGRSFSSEERSNLFSVIFFSWLNPVLGKGSSQPLEHEDLLTLAERDQAATIRDQFEEAWRLEMQRPAEKRSLVRALHRAFSLPVYIAFAFKLAQDLLLFVGPWLLNRLIQYVQDPTIPAYWGFVYSFALLFSNALQSVALHQYFHRCFRTGMVLRSAVVTCVYKKALRLSVTARQSSSAGEITNLMSVDAQRMQDTLTYLAMLWSAPLQIGIALTALYFVLDASIFAGFGVMILMIPLNGVITMKLRNIQKKQMVTKDARIKMMNEVLNGVKVIKLSAWENSFLDSITTIRETELSQLRAASFIRSVVSFLWAAAPTLVSLATFMTFTLVGNVLNSANAFTSISLFNILRFPLNALPMVINTLAEASVSVTRIHQFLMHDELDPLAVVRTLPPPESATLLKDKVVVSDASFSWTADEDAITLQNINFSAPPGSLIGIVGQVGSGKSSLVSAFLGEIPKLRGVVEMRGTTAYVPQTAWIQNATVRDNILFGLPFDEEKYARVVEACALLPDIEMLSAGDMTEIGEKGINLSGGQKQRVSLARAVYQDADIYFFDDPLSAVDAHVASHIFSRVLSSETGMLKDRVRMLVTHGEQFFQHCSEIVLLRDKTIAERGPWSELQKSQAMAAVLEEAAELDEHKEVDDPLSSLGMSLSLSASKDGSVPALTTDDDEEMRNAYLSRDEYEMTVVGESKRKEERDPFELETLTDADAQTGDDESDEAEETSALVPAIHRVKSLVGKAGEIQGAKIMSSEERATGSVALGVYFLYLKSWTVMISTLCIAMYILNQAASIIQSLWLTYWTDQDDAADDYKGLGFYLGIYAGLGGAFAVIILVRNILIVLGSLKSSRDLHNNMLHRVMRAPMSFFDTTPIGRVLNRFSKDVYVIDEVLPNLMGMFFSAVLVTLGIVVVICISTPFFMLLLIPIGGAFVFVQQYYIRSSRELQRLDSISRSPIYAHFSESLNGAASIRAYQREQAFIQENEERLDRNQMAYYCNIASNRWLAMRLEMLGACIIFFASLLGVLERSHIDPGLVGLSLSYALSVTQVLNWAVRMSCNVESNIVSVERVHQYAEIEVEAPQYIEHSAPPAEWPRAGAIEFNNVQVRYRPDLPLVLKGVNVRIQPREKIGLCGRTGSGKSTITLALFRLVELAGGSLLIDGVDISQIGLFDLRSKLSIVPQDPVLFSGSVRFNLDPFGEHDDARIWNALEGAHLKEFVMALEGGLSAEIAEDGSNLSAGEAQLLMLARALLRNTRILVLDEASSSIDYKTEALIQNTIREVFRDCTVITIAHRISSIMDCDKVLVLEDGAVMEFDAPQTLIGRQDSLFAALVRESESQKEQTAH